MLSAQCACNMGLKLNPSLFQESLIGIMAAVAVPAVTGPVFRNLQRSKLPNKPTIAFTMAPTHVAYANTLRRLILTSVPSVGFRAEPREDSDVSDISILANSTPMTNEMLAHRIGLLPVYAENPLEWNPDMYRFELHVENESEKPRDVTCSDFKISYKKDTEWIYDASLTERFFPRHPLTGDTCLIAILKERAPGNKPESIHLKARATLGIGRENARYIPTAVSSYAYTLDTDPANVKATFDKWLQNHKMISPDSIETDAVKKAALEAEFNTLARNRCFLKDPETGEPYSFDFLVESVGVLTCETIVERALEAGMKLCQRFGGESLPQDVTVQLANARMTGFDFIVKEQDHTLGHLLQAWLDQHLIGKGELTFAGYDVTHPLKDEIVIRLGTFDAKENTARQLFRQAAMGCAVMFQNWLTQWRAFIGGGIQVATAAARERNPTTAAKRSVLRPQKK